MRKRRSAKKLGREYSVNDWDRFTSSAVYSNTVIPELIDISDNMEEVPRLVTAFKEGAMQ